MSPIKSLLTLLTYPAINIELSNETQESMHIFENTALATMKVPLFQGMNTNSADEIL